MAEGKGQRAEDRWQMAEDKGQRAKGKGQRARGRWFRPVFCFLREALRDLEYLRCYPKKVLPAPEGRWSIARGASPWDAFLASISPEGATETIRLLRLLSPLRGFEFFR